MVKRGSLSHAGVEKLYERFARLMWQVAFNIVKDEMMAEDLVQEAFVNVLKNKERLSLDPDSVKTKHLLIIITRNLAYNRYKRDNRYEWLEAAVIDQHAFESGPEDMYMSKEQFEHLKDSLADLHDVYKDIILLTYVHGYSLKETAELLSVSHETARQRISRARRALKKRLTESRLMTDG